MMLLPSHHWSISSLIFTLPPKKKHPILWTPRANSHEVAKAVIQLGMFSGKYRVAMLTKHLSPSRSGTCPAPDCHDLETRERLFVSCTYYCQTREKLKRLWSGYRVPLLMDLIPDLLGGSPILHYSSF